MASICSGAGQGSDLIHGGEGDDIITGDRGDDYLMGGLGDDIIRGGGGNDFLIGNAGNDILIGDVGSDFLMGGEGAGSQFILRGDTFTPAAAFAGIAFSTSNPAKATSSKLPTLKVHKAWMKSFLQPLMSTKMVSLILLSFVIAVTLWAFIMSYRSNKSQPRKFNLHGLAS